MATLSLNLGFNPAPNTKGFFEGAVRLKDIDLKLESEFGEGLDNVGARHRKIIAGEFDGGELSISSFILARKRGIKLRALPVFLSRKFRHRCMYLPVKSPLRDPSELAGKKITIHRYNATTPVAPSVFEAMRPFYLEHFGNPSSPHHLGDRPASAIRDARARVAAYTGSHCVGSSGCACRVRRKRSRS